MCRIGAAGHEKATVRLLESAVPHLLDHDMSQGDDARQSYRTLIVPNVSNCNTA